MASAFWLSRAIVRSSEPEEKTYYKHEDYQRPHGCQRGIYGASPPYDDVLWPRISYRGLTLCRSIVSEHDPSSPDHRACPRIVLRGSQLVAGVPFCLNKFAEEGNVMPHQEHLAIAGFAMAWGILGRLHSKSRIWAAWAEKRVE